MRKALLVLAVIFFSLAIMSAKSISGLPMNLSGNPSKTLSEKNDVVPPIVVYVPVSQNFNVNGCTVSVSLTLAYVFNSSTLQLEGVFVSGSVSVTINCGTPYNYARAGSATTISVSNDQAVDVEFQSAGDGADDVLSDPGFQEDFVDMVNHNRPEP